MSRQDTFATYNPIINFIFYIGALAFGMFFIHPAFLVCSLLLSSAYYLSVKGRGGLKLIAGMLPLILLLGALNPLLNTGGETVLFTWLTDRPYTLEALFYGMALGVMFVSILLWFASYNAVMTSDKFLYIFGKLIPSLSLVLTMVLRLAPDFQRRIHQITGARKCIGKGEAAGTKREKAEDGLTVLSALTTWALEGGIITADSMRSRGYGSGKRTSFSIYSFDGRDKLLLTFMMILIAGVICVAARGGMAVTYTPHLDFVGTENLWTIIGSVIYFIFLSIPTVLNIVEGITWRILRSKI